MNMFSKVWPGQPENLFSFVNPDLGCCREGNRVQSVRSYLSFRVYFYLCTGQITAANPPDPGAEQGLKPGVGHDSKTRQPWGSALPQSRSAVVVVVREGEKGRHMPGRWMPWVPACVQLWNSLNPQQLCISPENSWSSLRWGPEASIESCKQRCCVWYETCCRGGVWREREGEKCSGSFLFCTQGCHLFI